MSLTEKMQVSLFGKHPSSSEYLHIDVSSDFMNAVCRWVETGYETLLQNRLAKKSTEIHHFCFFNAQKESMICGSMKMSHDSRQRQYPLVIAVEVTDYTAFFDVQEAVVFSKEICSEITKLLRLEYDVSSLKEALKQLSLYVPTCITEETTPSSIFMNEDFSETKLFFRPLEINDFITTMR